MKTTLLLYLTLFVLTLGCSQEKGLQSPSQPYFDIVRPAYSGDLAYKTTDFVAQYWRVAGNTGFNKSIYWIVEHLKKAGYVLESSAKEGDRLTYRIEKRPMEYPTWEPVSGELLLQGEEVPILSMQTNGNMVYLNSVSTQPDGITAEVVNLDENETENTKGKIGFTEARAGLFYDKMIREGALGIITYNNPDYLQPQKNTTSIQFRSLPPQTNTQFWGIALSYAAKEKLKEAMKRGSNKVTVNIKTNIYPSEELTIVADIKGKIVPQERLVFSAHIQEPGANDNASGVGAQLEMAVLSAQLMKSGQIDVDRTLTYLWGDEIISTQGYIEENAERSKDIKWGISLDMVGENTAITGGSFLIEKMPDPSAIWTRGNDKHSEWGGEVLSLEDMKPHYLTDFIIDNFKNQGAFANWEVNTNPFEGGSDHMPFLAADIPGLLLWHFTDQFYHTDNDRIDKVSQETLKNVGTGALASALTLVNATTATAEQVLINIEKAAKERLEAEYSLSAESLKNGGNLKDEKAVLKAWEDWYSKTMQTLLDMEQEPTKGLKTQIIAAQERLKKKVGQQLNQLKKN